MSQTSSLVKSEPTWLRPAKLKLEAEKQQQVVCSHNHWQNNREKKACGQNCLHILVVSGPTYVTGSVPRDWRWLTDYPDWRQWPKMLGCLCVFAPYTWARRKRSQNWQTMYALRCSSVGFTGAWHGLIIFVVAFVRIGTVFYHLLLLVRRLLGPLL